MTFLFILQSFRPFDEDGGSRLVGSKEVIACGKILEILRKEKKASR